MGLFKRRFVDVVERQLELFESEHASLVRASEAALRAYNRAPPAEAEERYASFLDVVDTARERLVVMRESFAASLDDGAAEEYREVFERRVRRRFPRFALELEVDE